MFLPSVLRYIASRIALPRKSKSAETIKLNTEAVMGVTHRQKDVELDR
jgi:hypothetical protein